MFEDLTIFRMADSMARHAAARTALAARNLANADTPGYRAREMPSFADITAGEGTPGPMALRATRAGHIASPAPTALARAELAGDQTSPNGNSVSLEQEMVRASEAEREHGRALAIYRHSMQVLRTAIGS
ncbi:FlgB family protein [Pseudoroseicyclus sp. H15]